jgi:hypothetical protein
MNIYIIYSKKIQILFAALKYRTLRNCRGESAKKIKVSSTAPYSKFKKRSNESYTSLSRDL